MADMAFLWLYAIWPLIFGLGIATVFRSRLSKLLEVLLIAVVVFGLQGICHLPYILARTYLLVDHSPNWMDSNQALSSIIIGGDILAALLSLILAGRIVSWASGTKKAA
jgi:hypothetical protein